MKTHNGHSGRHGGGAERVGIADRLLETMKLKNSDIVVDIGSGDGYYSSRFAEHCGKVMAVDSAREVFKGEYYAKDNIEAVCENACTWILKDVWEGVTHVFFSNSFHDMECQGEILSTLSVKLREGARLNLIEFH